MFRVYFSKATIGPIMGTRMKMAMMYKVATETTAKVASQLLSDC